MVVPLNRRQALPLRRGRRLPLLEFRILPFLLPLAACGQTGGYALIPAHGRQSQNLRPDQRGQDALAAVEAGADLLGFVLWEKSPRYVTLEKSREIARELPEATTRVGVFVDAKVEQVMFSLRICDFFALQFHGQESPAYCQQFGVMKIKAFRVRDAASLAPIANYDTEAILLDSYVEGQPGGTGETFNWALAAEAKKFDKPIFLAGGLTPQNVTAAVRAAQPFGVDVSSGVESAPGNKGPSKDARLCGRRPRGSERRSAGCEGGANIK